MTQRITRTDSPFSFIQQRLQYVAAHPEQDWTFYIENVPQWPTPYLWQLDVIPSGVTGYGPCDGEPGLRAAISRREADAYGVSIQTDQVLVTNGALHALALLFRMYARPGAVAICHAPVIASIGASLRSAGYGLRLVGNRDRELDLAELEDQITSDVRIIYVNSPNNPTGEICSPTVMERLVHIAHKHRIALIADVVYDSYLFGDPSITSPLQWSADWRQLFMVNSLSKNYGAPGARIGWIVSATENIQHLAGMLEQECIAVAGASQQHAVKLMAEGNQGLVARVREGHTIAAQLLRRLPGVHFCMPQGGTHLFAHLPVSDVEAFADTMLLKHGLVLATASNYIGVEGPFVRIPIGYSPETIQHAISLLARGLRSYRE